MNNIPVEEIAEMRAAFYKKVWSKKGELPDPKNPHYNGLGHCWEWGGQVDHGWYGIFIYKGKQYAAHRASFMIHHGDIPDGMVVRHKCDNPSCTNPDHLELGTRRQNVMDKIKRGRGNARINAKLEHVEMLRRVMEDAVYGLFNILGDYALEDRNAVDAAYSCLESCLREMGYIIHDEEKPNKHRIPYTFQFLLDCNNEHNFRSNDPYPKLGLRPSRQELNREILESIGDRNLADLVKKTSRKMKEAREQNSPKTFKED